MGDRSRSESHELLSFQAYYKITDNPISGRALLGFEAHFKIRMH
jgi:hypothetical protein